MKCRMPLRAYYWVLEDSEFAYARKMIAEHAKSCSTLLPTDSIMDDVYGRRQSARRVRWRHEVVGAVGIVDIAANDDAAPDHEG